MNDDSRLLEISSFGLVRHGGARVAVVVARSSVRQPPSAVNIDLQQSGQGFLPKSRLRSTFRNVGCTRHYCCEVVKGLPEGRRLELTMNEQRLLGAAVRDRRQKVGWTRAALPDKGGCPSRRGTLKQRSST